METKYDNDDQGQAGARDRDPRGQAAPPGSKPGGQHGHHGHVAAPTTHAGQHAPNDGAPKAARQPGCDHAQAGEQHKEGDHPARPVAAGDKAADRRHDQVAYEIARGQHASLRVGQAQRRLHRGQDQCVAKAGKAQATHHGQGANGQHDPAIVQTPRLGAIGAPANGGEHKHLAQLAPVDDAPPACSTMNDIGLAS